MSADWIITAINRWKYQTPAKKLDVKEGNHNERGQ